MKKHFIYRGGARSAYQAGVLQAIGEITQSNQIPATF